jgi:serine/threonine protein kinase
MRKLHGARCDCWDPHACQCSRWTACIRPNMLEARTPFYPVAAGELIGGKYHIESVLGEGGMGVVFAATHIDLHCPVALKVIRAEFQQQPELIARLMLEARAAAQIRSEHVCRVLDVARLDTGAPYVVMEYLEGKNLGAVLDAKGRLPEKLAVDYVLQACEALAEAHRIGIVHRDLKPENLFLAEFPDGRRAIKVLDFGISKMVGTTVAMASGSRLTNPSSAMGSPHYMAPEQMAAASDVDSRADIWALGAILHQLVTGCFAFDGTSLPAVCAAVLQSDPVPVRDFITDLSPGLEQTILACLVKDRAHRLADVAELANRLAPFGSASATQSVLRISRLMRTNSDTPESGGNSTGTLVSPRRLATPRTPLPRASGPTTGEAVTSSKRSFTAGSTHSTKSKALVGLAALALLVVISGWIAWSRASATHAPSTTSATPVDSSWAEPAASVNTVTSTAVPEAAVSPSDSVARAEPSAALNGSAVTAPITSASGVVAHPSAGPATAGVRAGPATPRRKSTANQDPYNLDNFGGRR